MRKFALFLLMAMLATLLTSCIFHSRSRPCRTECFWEKGRRVCEKRCR